MQLEDMAVELRSTRGRAGDLRHELELRDAVVACATRALALRNSQARR